jgi:hypothetical protein
VGHRRFGSDTLEVAYSITDSGINGSSINGIVVVVHTVIIKQHRIDAGEPDIKAQNPQLKKMISNFNRKSESLIKHKR